MSKQTANQKPKRQETKPEVIVIIERGNDEAAKKRFLETAGRLARVVEQRQYERRMRELAEKGENVTA
ncbi:MAG: hypothetical protein IJ740_07815 [Ruminococcus sp.]|nr:hypothetical protein [Ruminococcus sp.]